MRRRFHPPAQDCVRIALPRLPAEHNASADSDDPFFGVSAVPDIFNQRMETAVPAAVYNVLSRYAPVAGTAASGLRVQAGPSDPVIVGMLKELSELVIVDQLGENAGCEEAETTPPHKEAAEEPREGKAKFRTSQFRGTMVYSSPTRLRPVLKSREGAGTEELKRQESALRGKMRALLEQQAAGLGYCYSV